MESFKFLYKMPPRESSCQNFKETERERYQFKRHHILTILKDFTKVQYNVFEIRLPIKNTSDFAWSYLCRVIFTGEESHMLNDILKVKSRLSDIVEPDFGLLDELLSMEVLNRREYDDVRSERRAAYRRSEAILDLLTSEDQCGKFLKALQRTGQQHIVNFVTQSGG